jgi:hypothetical protein
VIDIATGTAASDDNTAMMTLANAMTKSLTAVSGQTGWTAGSGNWGLDTGTVAATAWYHVFLIQRPDTGAVDILFSTNVNPTATMPTNYTKKRRIGSIRTASSAILAFIQVGDHFQWVTPTLDVNGASWASGNTTVILTTPSGVKVDADITLTSTIGTAGTYFVIASVEQPTAYTVAGISTLRVQVANGFVSGRYIVRTDTASSILIYASTTPVANDTFVNTSGWLDNRGK